MKAKPQVDTQWQGSWAQQEQERPKVDRLSADFGKPAVLIPNLVTLGPIDHKWARIFNG